MRKLKLLLIATAAMLLGSANDVKATDWPGNAVGDGTYYLYNVGADRFLGYGANWGSMATLEHAGIPVTLQASDGGYKLITNVSANGRGLFIDNGGGCFVDNGSPIAWNFTAVAGLTNTYQISNGDKYLLWNSTDVNSSSKIDTDLPAAIEESYWILVSAADRDAAFSAMNATEAAPLDLTYKYIANPNTTYFTNIYSTTNPWSGDAMTLNSGSGKWTDVWNGKNYNGEFYNKNFDMYITIENVPNGKYEFGVQGYYRDGNAGNVATNINDNGGSVLNAKIYANGNTTDLQSIAVGKQTTSVNNDTESDITIGGVAYKIPNSQKSATTYFFNGYYPWQNVTTIVRDGTLRIGVKKATTISNDWTVLDKFYLSYLGPTIEAKAVELPDGGSMTADTWYYLDVAENGVFDLTASTLSNIVYTTDGTILFENSSSVTTTFASATEVRLAAGRYYLKSASAQSLTMAASTPVVADGDYYLYDATAKKFLTRGNNYGTRASVDKYGVPFTWSNFTQMITFKDWTGVNMFFDNSNHTACWVYTDGGDNRGDDRLFAFEATTGGYYLRDAAKAVYIKHDGNVLEVPTTEAAQATVWTLMTKAEHDAIVAGYAAENKSNVIIAAGLSTTSGDFESWITTNLAAKDYTSSVGTPKFTAGIADRRATTVGAWTWEETRAQNGDSDWQKSPAYGTDYAEAWNATGKWTQTINGLPEGLYKVTVNGFERRSTNAVSYALGQAGYGNVVNSYLKANDEQVQLKSWYDEVEKDGDNYNPNDVTQAATAFNNNKFNNEVYTYVGDDGKLELTVAKPSYVNDSWMLWNNITLTYYDDNVSDAEVTAIISEAETAMDSPMKASLYQALETAKSTFEESKTVPNYNALRTAIDNTATSITSYANMYTNYLEPINTYLATTNFVDQTSSVYTAYAAYKAAYDNYKNAETADVENATANGLNITRGGGTNYTSTYSQLLLPNWTIDGNAALTDGSGFYVNSWSVESEGTGDAADFATPFFEKWTGSGSIPACTLEGTVTGLVPNSAYDITAIVRVQGSSKVAGSITMEVVGGVPVDVTDGNQIGTTARYIKSYTATGVTDGSGNLVLRFNVAANSNISWLSFRDVNYAKNENVTPSNDFTTLNSAISTVENSLGFENGEYAPYNNINKVNALTTAKSFDQDRYHTPAAITAATTALTSVAWTEANDGEVNAIFWDYSSLATTDKSKAYGWYDPALGVNAEGSMYSTRVFNHINGTKGDGTDANPGLGAVENNVALFTKKGTNYGKVEGYTLPLKANRTYKLSFKYAGWTEPSESTISIIDENGENPIEVSGVITVDGDAVSGNSSTAAWADYEGYFTVPSDGNYILNVNRINMGGNTQRQLVMGNISLVTADALIFANVSVPTYAPGTYPTVKITRTLTAGRWATAVYPFAVSGVDNIAVLDSYNKDTGALGFTSVTASTANEPFFMRSTAGTTEITLSNVDVKAVAAAPVATKDEASLKGAYTTTEITNAEKNYVLSENTIYSVGTKGATIDPYRAYIQIAQDAAPARALSFFIDGDETTGIEGIDAQTNMLNGTVYNLNGQRVEKVQKGLYIVNGKKVVVKK